MALTKSEYYQRYKAQGKFDTPEHRAMKKAADRRKYAKKNGIQLDMWTPCRPELDCEVCAANPDNLK